MLDEPRFRADEPPPAIVNRAGEWLAEQLLDGFKYLRSKREVVRRGSGRTEGIGLQTSSWSRQGQGTWVEPRVWVTDAKVSSWQRSHGISGSLARGGYIFNSMVVNLGLPLSVELFGPIREQDPRPPLSLTQFLEALQNDLLPNVRTLREGPAVAATNLPDRWLLFPEPLFWWATAYGDKSSALRFLSRYFGTKTAVRAKFDEGRRLAREGAGAPIPMKNHIVNFGWSAASSGALDDDDEF